MSLFSEDFKDSLNYSDVFIIPKHSDISSRQEVDISSELNGVKIPVPVISANMESVTGARMANAMRSAGGLGALHRFQSIERAVEDLVQNQKDADNKDMPILVSVGVNRDSHDRAQALYDEGAKYFIVDIAHGHSEHMQKMIEFLKDKADIYVIAGNVATSEAAYDLCMWGADAIKVGIGPGSVCTTKNVTGVTVPGFQSVVQGVHGVRTAEVKAYEKKLKRGQITFSESVKFGHLSLEDQIRVLEKNRPRIPVIADGGMTEIGDICKALGAGADFVMSGRFFAACDEAPNGAIYRGSASQDVQAQYRNDKQLPTPEGKTDVLEAAGPVKGVVDSIAGGVRSAFSYVGARNIKEYHEKCSFGVRKHPQKA